VIRAEDAETRNAVRPISICGEFGVFRQKSTDQVMPYGLGRQGAILSRTET
jgi:hypothetical protein